MEIPELRNAFWQKAQPLFSVLVQHAHKESHGHSADGLLQGLGDEGLWSRQCVR